MMTKAYDAGYHYCIVRNWRSIANIPGSIADHELWKAIEEEEIHLFTPEEAVEILRERFHLT
jgi:hypothetical protein